jgi:hypothetical protein
MPDDFAGDVWVFSKHLEQPELARTHLFQKISGQVIRVFQAHLFQKISGQVIRVFQDIYTVDDSDGCVVLFDDVTHYMEVVPPAPPTVEVSE